MPEVRKATRADVPSLARMLARAFDDDPVMAWCFRDEGRRARWAERWFRIRFDALLAHGETYTTPDLAGAAIWAQPERWRPGPAELLKTALLFPGVGRHVIEVLRGLDRVEKAHPARPPHYYLAVLGAAPERQGEGVGSAVLQPVLEDCDANQIPAYLETAKERNTHFYARHGFRVTREMTMPNGPPVWLMWRDPR